MTDTMPSYRLHVKPRCVRLREPSIQQHISDKRTKNPKSPSLILRVPASALTPKLLDFCRFHYSMILFGIGPILQTLDVAKVFFSKLDSNIHSV